jgi:hypothetical protein
MNERIKELLTPKLKEWAGDSDDNFSEELEKFAELIVRECMEVANTYQNRGGNCYVHNMIAKHFGVEEYNDEGDEE